MIKSTYTLDRVENAIYVFLEKGNEESELQIPADEVHLEVKEGDIVEIEHDGFQYRFLLLDEETENRREDVASLIEKLKNRQ